MDRAWQLAPGITVRAAGGSPEAAALAEVFPAFEASESLALPTGPRLEGADAGAARRVSLDGLALFTAPADELAPALEAALLGWVVRTRADVVPLHASAVAWAGKAVLFLGEKGSGKSTLAALLGAELAYLGDEVAFVRIPGRAERAERVEGPGPVRPERAKRVEGPTSELVLVPFPKAATIKAGAFDVVPASPSGREWIDPLRGRVRYHAPAVSSRADLPIGALVWPQWRAATSADELAPLAPEETAVRLIHQTFGGLERDPRTLDTIVALAARPAFALAYTSTAGARAALEKALGRP